MLNILRLIMITCKLVISKLSELYIKKLFESTISVKNIFFASLKLIPPEQVSVLLLLGVFTSVAQFAVWFWQSNHSGDSQFPRIGSHHQCNEATSTIDYCKKIVTLTNFQNSWFQTKLTSETDSSVCLTKPSRYLLSQKPLICLTFLVLVIGEHRHLR
jgi:hypothetical protein